MTSLLKQIDLILWKDNIQKKVVFFLSIFSTCLYIGALVLEQIDLILWKDDKCEKLSAAAWNGDLGGIVKTFGEKIAKKNEAKFNIILCLEA